MRNYLFLIMLILIYSCNEKNSVDNEKKVNKVVNEEKIDDFDAVKEVGRLYQPEKIVVKLNRIGTNAEKEDYIITLTNSDSLDSDLENIEKHAQKTAIIYHRHLMRVVKPFNFKRIIVKIEHRNSKIDSFEYSENNINKLLNIE